MKFEINESNNIKQNEFSKERTNHKKEKKVKFNYRYVKSKVGVKNASIDDRLYQKYLASKSFYDSISEREYTPQDLKEVELNVIKILNFNYANEKDWSQVSNIYDSPCIFNTIVSGSKCKTTKRLVGDEKFPVNIYSKVFKDPDSVINPKSWDSLLNWLLDGVDDVYVNFNYPRVSSMSDLVTKDIKDFLPAFVINDDLHIKDPYLMKRIQEENVRSFRLDPKIAFQGLKFASYPIFKDLRSVKWIRCYFLNNGFPEYEPFVPDRYDDQRSLFNSCSVIWLVCLLNIMLFEINTYHVLKKYGFLEFIDQFIHQVLIDNPVFFFQKMNSEVSNEIRTYAFCFANMTECPAVKDSKIVTGFTFRDNLRDYTALQTKVYDFSRDYNLPTLPDIVDRIMKVADRDSILLVQLLTGITTANGYNGSDIIEAINSQAYQNHDTLHELYGLNVDEAKKQAEVDWEYLKTFDLANYDEMKDAYFKDEMYKRDFIPKDFDYGGSSIYKEYIGYVEDIVKDIISDCTTNHLRSIFDYELLRKKVYDIQTSKGAGESLVINIPKDVLLVNRRRRRKELSVVGKSEKDKVDMISLSLTTKKAVAPFMGSQMLLNKERALRRNLVKVFSRKVPGSKKMRAIMNLPIQDYTIHYAIAKALADAMQKHVNFQKPKGNFIVDYVELIEASSNLSKLLIYLDFKNFDGSVVYPIQEGMAKVFKMVDYIFSLDWVDQDGKPMTIGEVIYSMQTTRWRSLLITKHAGRTRVQIVNMTVSGEFLTNTKGSFANYGLLMLSISIFKRIDEGQLFEVRVETLRISGDDSAMVVHVSTDAYNVINNGRYVKVELTANALDVLDRYSKEMSEAFEKIGFYVSGSKGGISYGYVEYLRKYIRFGWLIFNWRLQLFVVEKRNDLFREFLAITISSISRSMSERGFLSNVMWRYTMFTSLVAGTKKISRFEFLVSNIAMMFAPISDGGYGLAMDDNLFLFPSSTLYAVNHYFYSHQFGVRNIDIKRFYSNCYEDEPMLASALRVAKAILEGKDVTYGSSTFEPKLYINDFNSLRDQFRIRDSLEAYNDLKRLGLTFNKDNTYFRGFVKYLASSISTVGKFNATSAMIKESLNSQLYFNLLYYDRIKVLSPTEAISSNVLFDVYSENVIDFSKDCYITIGSDYLVTILNIVLGYDYAPGKLTFEIDLIDFIRRRDSGAPSELNNDMLISTLTKLEYISSLRAFTLACRAFGISEDCVGDLFSLISNNYFNFLYTTRSEMFSYMSEVISVSDFTPNNVERLFNYDFSEYPNILKYFILSLAMTHFISKIRFDRLLRIAYVPVLRLTINKENVMSIFSSLTV